MPAETHLFLCLKDNFGVLLHDPTTGATAAIDAPEADPVEKALADLKLTVPISNPKMNITEYKDLAEATTWLHQSWSGDLLGAALFYMPKGTDPSVLSYWWPGKGKGMIFRRGEIIRRVDEQEMVDALLEEIDIWEKEEAERGPSVALDPNGRVKLPLLS